METGKRNITLNNKLKYILQVTTTRIHLLLNILIFRDHLWVILINLAVVCIIKLPTRRFIFVTQ